MTMMEVKGMKYADVIRQYRPKVVRIRFRHGLGDAAMFYRVCLPAIQAAFPDVRFIFDTHLGQEALFGMDDSEADMVLEPSFPCAEWDGDDLTKPEKCLRDEFGLDVPFLGEKVGLPKSPRPIVGVHFLSTCISWLCAGESQAKEVWKAISDAGAQPLDTHLKHVHAHADPWDWEEMTCKGVAADMEHLCAVIASCSGFAGVASGNFNLALSILPPERVLFLRTNFSVAKLTRLPVKELDIRGGVDTDEVRRWVYSLPNMQRDIHTQEPTNA